MTKTNTDEAYRRYCAEYGICNRVVFNYLSLGLGIRSLIAITSI